MFRTSQKQPLLSRLPRHKEAVGQEVNGPRWKDTFVKSDTGKEVHPGSQREGVRASVPCGPKGFELPSWPKGCANHGSRAQLKPFSCTLHVFICIYVIIYLYIMLEQKQIHPSQACLKSLAHIFEALKTGFPTSTFARAPSSRNWG